MAAAGHQPQGVAYPRCPSDETWHAPPLVGQNGKSTRQPPRRLPAPSEAPTATVDDTSATQIRSSRHPRRPETRLKVAIESTFSTVGCGPRPFGDPAPTPLASPWPTSSSRLPKTGGGRSTPPPCRPRPSWSPLRERSPRRAARTGRHGNRRVAQPRNLGPQVSNTPRHAPLPAGTSTASHAINPRSQRSRRRGP